jgi:adenylate cyclase
MNMNEGVDLQRRYSHLKHNALRSIKNVNPVENSSIGYQQQYQKILNLYHSGIPPQVIAFQLDTDEEDIRKVIRYISSSIKSSPSAPFSVSSLENKSTVNNTTTSLDAMVNTDIAIKNAQVRMWKALQSEPEITLSLERTNEVLRNFARSKVMLVTLHADLVDSTELSVSLPLEKLSTILQTFMQEVASVIVSYGGYILKYIGDAVLGFFVVPANYRFEKNIIQYDDSNCHTIDHKDQKDNLNNAYIPCMNAVNCARSILKILDQAINPILNQYGYPEMSVRIGIDIGENVVIQDGWDIQNTK